MKPSWIHIVVVTNILSIVILVLVLLQAVIDMGRTYSFWMMIIAGVNCLASFIARRKFKQSLLKARGPQ